MNVDIAVRRTADALGRTTSDRFPVAPLALVTGRSLELSVGDPDQPFFVASIDKVFIATLVAQLAADGLLRPDSPLGELLPDEDLAPLPAAPGIDNARHVTVEHLLTHTAGLPDVMLPPRGHETECAIPRLLADPSRVWTIQEFLQQAAHLPPFARPGARFCYSDTGYFLLIRIIEEATGVGFAEQLRAGIFEPAGMTDSAEWVGAGADRLDTLATTLAPFWLDTRGSEVRTGDVRRAFAPNLTWTNGLGGPSTAHDLVRFQRALHGGELLDPTWIDFFARPRNRFRPGIHYGAGMNTLLFGGFFPTLRGYPRPVGGLGYTATHMYYYPEQQTHVILNYHAHRRMQASFLMHIRLAGLIRRHG